MMMIYIMMFYVFFEHFVSSAFVRRKPKHPAKWMRRKRWRSNVLMDVKQLGENMLIAPKDEKIS